MITTFDLQAGPETSPVVEIDSETLAAYVRFTDHPVAETRPAPAEDCIVTVDFDASGKVIGVELIGVREFRVDQLLRLAGIPPLTRDAIENTRYIPASKTPRIAA